MTLDRASPAFSSVVAFVGGGQMATAMISGLISGGWDARSIWVIEPNIALWGGLRSLGVEVFRQSGVELAKANVIIWAVKPQVLSQAIRQALPNMGSALRISIAAGLPRGVLTQWLQSERVVRVMPNTGALMGAGVTGMVAAEDVSGEDRAMVERVLASTGYCFWVDGDERLDAVTAVSGSGPAYVFHFLEGFQRAAEAQGFEPALARELVLRVAAGAIKQAGLGDSFDLLRARVTSKGGTTEAALNVLNEQGVSSAILDAVQAAYVRAGDLARTLS